MKNHLIAFSFLLLSAGAAQAAMTDNAFVSVLGGWSSHPDLTVGAGRVPVDDGYNVGARIGTSVDALPNFTVDADYFYNRGDYTHTGAHLNSTSGMVDLMYHLPMDWPVNLYGGAGIGVVNTNFTGSLHGGSAVLGWQGIGGAELPLNGYGNTSLFAEYRYQNAHDANVGAVQHVGNTSNNVSVGVKFHM